MTTAATAHPSPRDKLAWTWLICVALATGSVVAGVVAGALAESGRPAGVLAIGAVALIVVLWRHPQFVPMVVLITALTVEQFPLTLDLPDATTVGARHSDVTDRIPLFHGFANSIHGSPADVFLVVLLVIWLLKTGTEATVSLRRSPISMAVIGLLAAVALGVLVGQAHGGALHIAMTEIRPYVYLAATYLIVSVFITTRRALRAVLWAIVLGSGFKAAQAVVAFLSIRHLQPRPDYIVGHEEALFFGLFIVLTLALWLFEVNGALRTTATALLPLVIAADLVNSRRAAWLILGGALLVLAIIGLVCLPSRRRLLGGVLVAFGVFSAVYFPVYWNHTGALAGPARAIHSAISANPRDASSDLYRVQENANLRLNIRQGGLLGKGFGVPIDYPLLFDGKPITDISGIDPLIKYIPHNGVLYILMRMGVLGGIAFWSLLAAGIICGCRLARSRDREIAVVGALIACALVAYALEGYNDQGFFLYRVAFVIGSLLGLGEVARRLNAKEPEGEASRRKQVVSRRRHRRPRRPA